MQREQICVNPSGEAAAFELGEHSSSNTQRHLISIPCSQIQKREMQKFSGVQHILVLSPLTNLNYANASLTSRDLGPRESERLIY
jgi:hypothetical protein